MTARRYRNFAVAWVLLAVAMPAQAQLPEISIPEVPEIQKPLPRGAVGTVEIVPVQREEPRLENLDRPLKGAPVQFEDPKAEKVAPPTRVVDSPLNEPTASRPATEELGFYVGVGFFFVRPVWESNLAYTRSTFSGGQTAFATVDFNHDLSLAPRVVFGYTDPCCGLGLGVSWWRFDQTARMGFVNPFVFGFTTQIAGPGNTPGTSSNFSPVNNFTLFENQFDTLLFENRVVADVYDFDFSQRFSCNECWSLTAGAGIRYAYISQYYHALSIRNVLVPGTANTREVNIRNQITAGGPDLFLEGRANLRRFGLAVYANARGGFLYGAGRYSQVSDSRILTVPGFAPTVFHRDDSIDRNVSGLPFMETEIGLEWQGRGITRIQPFLRLGFTGQTWFGLGNATTASGNTHTNGNFGLMGGTLLGGVSF